MMPLWLELFFLLGIPCILIIVIAAWAIDYFWLTPKESKMIKKAARKKMPLVGIGHDDGYFEYKVTKDIGDEGYIKTRDGWIGFLPRPVAVTTKEASSEVGAGSSEAPADNPGKVVTETRQLTTRVFMLRHAKVPIVHGYAGKAVLTNVQVLAALEYANNAKKEKVKLPFQIKGEQVEANVFWPVDLRTIKSVFPKSWNQAQIRAAELKAELTGFLKGKKHFGIEGLKYFVLPGMIIIAIIILAIILMVLA